MSGATRDFDLGDILSVTTDRLLSPRHIDGIYDILNFLTGENLMTHQLPRACRQVRAGLLAQHPDLADIVVPEFGGEKEALFAWLNETKAVHGETRTVSAMPTEDPPDPIEEAADLVGAEKVWIFPNADEPVA